MQTKTLIEASAEVLTITRLRAGDVYKRINSPAYAGDATLAYGVVQSVMNNGEDSAFSALELTPSYSGVTAASKVFAAGQNLMLFPATPEELQMHCQDVQVTADKAVSEARKKLEEVLATQELVGRTIGRVLRGELTAPVTSSTPLAIGEDSSQVESLVADASTEEL